MNDQQMWSLLLGVVLPPVAAIVMQPKWSSATRAVVSVAICLLIGAGQVFFDANEKLDAVTAQGVVHAFLLVLVAAQAAYRGIWQHLPVTHAIENATSGTGTAT